MAKGGRGPGPGRAPQRKSSSKSTSSTSTLVFGFQLLFSFIVLILLAFGILSIATNSTHHDLNSVLYTNHHSPDHQHQHQPQHQHQHQPQHQHQHQHQQWVELLSWEPRAFVYHNFLSKEECEYLIEVAKPHMQKSSVVDEKSGKSQDSRVRTSSGTFLPRGRDKIIRRIEQKIADFTFIPAEHGEGLQVLHYEVGQKYEPHFDYFLDDFNTANGGQRMATLLMYLSDVEEGGETVFPSAKGNFSSVSYWNQLSECGQGGLSTKPKRGDALLFWSIKPDTSLDPSSLHGGCPVIKGDKWSATKWLRLNEYQT